MKALEFIYQDTAIHFLLDPTDENIMVNATEMAKAYKKNISDFTRLKSTKSFIKALEKDLNLKNNVADVRQYPGQTTLDLAQKGGQERIICTQKRGGTYMNRKLAIKFAAWLDVNFELWIINIIDELLLANVQEVTKTLIDLHGLNVRRIELIEKAKEEKNIDFLNLLDIDNRIATLKNQERRAIRQFKKTSRKNYFD